MIWYTYSCGPDRPQEEDICHMKTAMKSGWGRIAMAVTGALIYALGVNLFVVPLGLFTGGLMGLCQLLRSLVLMVLGVKTMTFDFAGVILLAFNVPLLILAYRSMGRVFFRNTLICSMAYTVFTSIVPIPPAPLVEDMLTGCLLGGVISGVGSGLALTSGCCGGGLDLLGQRRLEGVHIAGGSAAGRAAKDGVDVQAGAVGHLGKGESAAALFTHDLFSSRVWGQKRTVNCPMGNSQSSCPFFVFPGRFGPAEGRLHPFPRRSTLAYSALTYSALKYKPIVPCPGPGG